MTINVDNIPRTIRLVRAGASDLPASEGFFVLELLDQTKLPDDIVFERIVDWREVIEAIKELRVRGAPAIGIAGAAAVALRAAQLCCAQSDASCVDPLNPDRAIVEDEDTFDPEAYLTEMRRSTDIIASARPTAVNLMWAVDRCMRIVDESIKGASSPLVIADALFDEVAHMISEDEVINRAIGDIGAAFLPENARVLTHCNAGSLATSFYGTALGVVYSAAGKSGVGMVYADETRPVCQGSRLTVWELSRAGIPVTLICDDMAADVLSHKGIDAVIVGADRIAANGDVANKIGTLGLAVLANEFGVPFYVAAPVSTIDADMLSGEGIEIEQRRSSEVMHRPIDGVDVYNPAFDITPARYIDRIFTEAGAFKPSDILDAL